MHRLTSERLACFLSILRQIRCKIPLRSVPTTSIIACTMLVAGGLASLTSGLRSSG